jgi:hypothetical protein
VGGGSKLDRLLNCLSIWSFVVGDGTLRIANNVDKKKKKKVENQTGWYLAILTVFSFDKGIYVGVFMLGLLGVPFQTCNGQCVCTLGEVHKGPHVLILSVFCYEALEDESGFVW